jgi:hypothetical protein
MEAKLYLTENNVVDARKGWVVSVPATTLCLSIHKIQGAVPRGNRKWGWEGADALSLQAPGRCRLG